LVSRELSVELSLFALLESNLADNDKKWPYSILDKPCGLSVIVPGIFIC